MTSKDPGDQVNHLTQMIANDDNSEHTINLYTNTSITTHCNYCIITNSMCLRKMEEKYYILKYYVPFMAVLNLLFSGTNFSPQPFAKWDLN